MTKITLSPLSLVSRLIEWLVKILKKSVKRAVGTLRRTPARKLRNIALAYVASVVPLNYATVSALTPASFTSPSQVLTYALDSGVTSVLTGGISKVITSGATTAAGGALEAFGAFVEVDGIRGKGAEIAASGREWFDGAGEYSNSIRDLGSEFKMRFPPIGGALETIDQTGRNGDYYNVNGEATLPAECEGLQPGEIRYQGVIDAMGRVGAACGNITWEVRDSNRDRDAFKPGSDPAGWGHNDRASIPYSSKSGSYNGYFYNRSHLLADSLGGAAEYKNLVTGTRTQNVGEGSGGMAYTESLTREFIDSNKSCPVVYAAQPVYTGDEIVPRTIEVDILSCDGALNQSVTVFNDAAGHAVNYVTGEFAKM